MKKVSLLNYNNFVNTCNSSITFSAYNRNVYKINLTLPHKYNGQNECDQTLWSNTPNFYSQGFWIPLCWEGLA